MALVASSWAWVPPPVQQPPVVTEEAIVVPHVPPIRVHDRVVLESWQVVPQPQRFQPRATLPSAVFDSPLPETRKRAQALSLTARSWILPQARQLEVYSPVIEHIPPVREHVIVRSSWNPLVEVKQRAARHVLPQEAFDSPLPESRKRAQLLELVSRSWIPVHVRQPVVHLPVLEHVPPARDPGIIRGTWNPPVEVRQRPSRAVLPQEAFDNPPLSSRALLLQVIADSWRPGSPVQQRSARVTEGEALAVALVPYSRDRIAYQLWIPPANVLQVPSRAILPAQVFPNAPGPRNTGILEIRSWQPGPPAEVLRPKVPGPEHVPYVRDKIVQGLWPQHVQAPQGFSSAVLPGEVFPNPPLGQRARQYQGIILGQWFRAPEVLQRPSVVAPDTVFIPFTRDRLAYTQWQQVVMPPRHVTTLTESPRAVPFTRDRLALLAHTPPALIPRWQPSAILPEAVFPDPPPGDLRREINGRIVFELWKYTPLPQRWLPNASLPSEVFDNPPVESRKRAQLLESISSSWLPGPIRQRQVPTDTDSLLPPPEYFRERIVIGQWTYLPMSQGSFQNATLPPEVFPNPPSDARKRAQIFEIVAHQWIWVPEPKQLLRNASLPPEAFPDPPLGDPNRKIYQVLVHKPWIWVPMPQRAPTQSVVSGFIYLDFNIEISTSQPLTITSSVSQPLAIAGSTSQPLGILVSVKPVEG